jgi:hypothetical protein
LFQGLIIGEIVGVVEKEKGPGEEKQKKREDKRIDDIEGPSLPLVSFALIRGEMIFHEESTDQKRENRRKGLSLLWVKRGGYLFFGLAVN